MDNYIPDYFVSPHFKISEFYNTHQSKHFFENQHEFFTDPAFAIRAAHIALKLEKVRSYCNCPITINSGFRYPALNKAVGGVNHSQHLCMLAVDITCSRFSSLVEYFSMVQDPYFYQIIFYDTFIHIGFYDPINIIPEKGSKPIYIDKREILFN